MGGGVRPIAYVYDSPPGKQTFISAQLRREAKRWYSGRMAGLTTLEITQDAPEGFYTPTGAESNLFARPLKLRLSQRLKAPGEPSDSR